MKSLRYCLRDGCYINRALLTPPIAEPRHFDRVPLPGRVNEWLSKGFSIHENPFRRWFAEDRRGRKPQLPSILGRVSEILHLKAGDSVVSEGLRYGPFEPYFPFGNVNVDRSAFYYEPTALRRYAFWILDAAREMEISISLWTCGAATLWQGESLVVDFAPFTRNAVKRWDGSLRLAKGLNRFFLCHDDLAERDTDFYYRIAVRPRGCAAWPEGEEPSIVLPLSDSCDPKEILRAEAALDSLHTLRECTVADEILLSSLPNSGNTMISIGNAGLGRRPAEEENPLPLTYAYISGEGGVQICGLASTRRSTFDASASGPIRLAPYEGDLPRIVLVALERELPGLRVSKALGIQLVNKENRSSKTGLIAAADRPRRALKFLASSRADDAYAALARLAIGSGPAADSIEAAFDAALDKVDARHDCADFTLVPVIHAYMEFRDSLSERLKSRILDSLTNFRYWCDEPGDDVMWFFSENHALLFHSCELFAGTLMPDRVFPNAGLTGREHRVKAVGLLNAWFARFFQESITEWNSSAYIPVDVHGLSALYGLCDIPDLREKARRALDMLFRTLALYSFQGVLMGTFGRSYEKELRGNHAAGTTALLWIGFGTGCPNTAGLAYVELCLSGYEAAPGLARLVELGEGGERAAGANERGLLFMNTQGWKRHVDCCLYKSPRVMLSSAVDFRPGKPGYQEHILHAALSPSAQCWINHPGETRPGGSGRPSFWAGNGILPRVVQYRNLAIALWNGAEDPEAYDPLVDWTHAYLPLAEFDEFITGPDCAVVCKDGFYIGIRAANGLRFIETGETAAREARSPGLRNAWLIVVDGKRQFSDLASFKTHFDGLGFSLQGDNSAHFSPDGQSGVVGLAATLTHPDYGPIIVPWSGTATVSGEPISHGSVDAEGVLELW